MMTIPDELVMEGIARAFTAFLEKPETGDRIVAKIAELRSELMTTAEAAALLRCSPKTLLSNHVEWGMAKSVALGPDNPRWHRAQILERVGAKEIKGRKADGVEKVTNFPQSTSTGSVPVGKQKAS